MPSLRLLYLLGFLAVSACCSPSFFESLPVALRPQETGMWCWAASGEMTAEYIGGGNVQQCQEANARFGRADCCNSPTPAACVMGGWPDTVYSRAGLTYDRTSNAALSLTYLKRQISQKSACVKKPFAFSWHWNGGGGHMMVARGYLALPFFGLQMVQVNDPWAPNVGNVSWIRYSRYVSGSTYTHWDDFYNIRR